MPEDRTFQITLRVGDRIMPFKGYDELRVIHIRGGAITVNGPSKEFLDLRPDDIETVKRNGCVYDTSDRQCNRYPRSVLPNGGVQLR